MNYSEAEKLFGLPPGYTDCWSNVRLEEEKAPFQLPPGESPSWEELQEVLGLRPLVIFPKIAPFVNKIREWVRSE